MKREEIIKFLIIRSLGNFLLLLAIYGVGATFGPILYFEAQYHIAQARGVHYAVADISESGKSVTPTPASGKGFGDLGESQTHVLTPVDPNFDVIIPKIGANSKVFPNVDASNQDEFLPLLLQGVAHAKGSVFPGLPGTTYLFAHSTDNWWDVGRYNAVFYLLKDLDIGDDVVIFFEGKRFNYSVTNKVVVDPSDVSALTNSHSGPERIILQTCWPPGTTWQRILVTAERKKS
jgi:LPXTG-site transpeptidase (sortase) family protein